MISTFAWFQQTQASVTATRERAAETVTVDTTDAVASNIKFAVTVDDDSTTLQLTDSNGKTGYWDAGLDQAVTGIDPESGKGEHHFTFTVTATKTTGAMTFKQALKAFYTNQASDGVWFSAVTGSDLRAVNASSNSYGATAGDDVLVQLAAPANWASVEDDATNYTWTVHITVSIAAHNVKEVISGESTAGSYYSVSLYGTVGDKSGDAGAFVEFTAA